MFRELICALGFATFALNTSAGAATLAIQEIDTGIARVCNASTGFTCGLEFTALNDITVTALGAFDQNSDGFGDALTPAGVVVNLFDLAGNTLASATVTSADRLAGASLPGLFTGDWRMADLPTGIELAAGRNYVMSVFGIREPSGTQATSTLAGDIGYVASRVIVGNAFPTNPGLGVAGSANLEYVLTAVPLPGGLILLGTGLFGFGFLRRRC